MIATSESMESSASYLLTEIPTYTAVEVDIDLRQRKDLPQNKRAPSYPVEGFTDELEWDCVIKGDKNCPRDPDTRYYLSNYSALRATVRDSIVNIKELLQATIQIREVPLLFKVDIAKAVIMYS